MGKMQSHRFNKYRYREGFCFNFCNFKTQRVVTGVEIIFKNCAITFCIVYSTGLS